MIPVGIAAGLGFYGFPSFDRNPNDVPSPEANSNESLLLSQSPSLTTQQLIHKVDDGIINRSEANPMQQFRYQLLETKTWKNTEKSMTLQYQKPREKIIRVHLQHY